MKRWAKAPLCRRTATGQGLIEGVSGLLLLTMCLVLFIGFLMNVGFSAYYKEQIGFICDQAARYASSLSDENPVENQQKIEKYVAGLFKQLGIAGQNIKVTVADKYIDEAETISVEIATDLPILQPVPGLFPTQLSLKERSLSFKAGLEVTSYLKFALPQPSSGSSDSSAGSASNVTATNGLFDQAMGKSSKSEVALGVLVPVIKARGLTAHAETKNHTPNKPILHAGTKETSGIGGGGEHQNVVYAHPTKSII